MYDLSFLPAGDARRSGDAIALRFTRPDTGETAHVVIDAGYPGDGRRLTVEHARRAWGVERVDLAILTHPDPDHVGGMEEVLSMLEVGTLWAHRPALHGDDRSKAARRVERLMTLAQERGTAVVEPWAGLEAFGGALRVLGPELAYYEELMTARIAPVFRGRLIGGLRWVWERLTLLLPWEPRFDDEEGVTRFNNGSTVMRLSLPGLRAVLTADAGVPALGRAWDDGPFDLLQIPHHGSRRNASSALLDRMLGRVGAWAGDRRVAVVSVAPGSRKHPSPRVLRAYARRGCEVRATAGRVVRIASGPEEDAEPSPRRRPSASAWESSAMAAEVLRYAAFTDVPDGGNPAGVVLDASGLSEAEMQAIAAEVGYSETAFVCGGDEHANTLKVRYFSPLAEVPFCGHATIATGIALAEAGGGTGRVTFETLSGPVGVVTAQAGGAITATLESVPPRVAGVAGADLAEALAALGWTEDELDPALPPRVAFAGAHHLVVAAGTRERLARLDYDFDRLGELMGARDWTTLQLVWRESADRFHARNPFPPGGVVEDPATGAAAAALGGYLRDLEAISPPARVTVLQGEDLGRPGRLIVDIPAGGAGIAVTGTAVRLPLR